MSSRTDLNEIEINVKTIARPADHNYRELLKAVAYEVVSKRLADVGLDNDSEAFVYAMTKVKIGTTTSEPASFGDGWKVYKAIAFVTITLFVA